MNYAVIAALSLSLLPSAGAQDFKWDSSDPARAAAPQLDAAKNFSAAKAAAARAAAAQPPSDVKPGRYRIAIEGLAYGSLLTQRYKLTGSFVVGERDVNYERVLTSVDLTMELLPDPQWQLSGATLKFPQPGCGQRLIQYMKDAPQGAEILIELETCFRGVQTGTVLDSRLSDQPRFFLWPFCSKGLSGCRMGMLSGLYTGTHLDSRFNATGDTFPIVVEPAPEPSSAP
ncbi:MAG: hypothetical protein HY077_00470 [Elusimicrobia bacterium]|nr:hypothetical protein [Elusimicrobiota bacterium]